MVGSDSPNLLGADAWTGFREGFARDGDALMCGNGADSQALRGASQTVLLNQPFAAPIIAEAWSRAENAGGTRDSDYSLYLDLVSGATKLIYCAGLALRTVVRIKGIRSLMMRSQSLAPQGIYEIHVRSIVPSESSGPQVPGSYLPR